MNKGGPPLEIKKKKRLEMVQSELFWSLFVTFFFFLESGATPVYPETVGSYARAQGSKLGWSCGPSLPKLLSDHLILLIVLGGGPVVY